MIWKRRRTSQKQVPLLHSPWPEQLAMHRAESETFQPMSWPSQELSMATNPNLPPTLLAASTALPPLRIARRLSEWTAAVKRSTLPTMVGRWSCGVRCYLTEKTSNRIQVRLLSPTAASAMWNQEGPTCSSARISYRRRLITITESY